MKERITVTITILVLSSLALLIYLNWNMLDINELSKQSISKTIEYWGDNFFVIKIDKYGETLEIISGDSLFKTLENEFLEIKNPNLIISNKNL